MVDGLIGVKVGMTQVFDEDGSVIPVTVIKAGPCVVVQRKMKDKDGYDALQLGLVEFVRPGRVKKPRAGHFKKAGVPPCRVLREFRFDDGDVAEGRRPGAGRTRSFGRPMRSASPGRARGGALPG